MDDDNSCDELGTRMKILDDIPITLRIYFEHETILFNSNSCLDKLHRFHSRHERFPSSSSVLKSNHAIKNKIGGK